MTNIEAKFFKIATNINYLCQNSIDLNLIGAIVVDISISYAEIQVRMVICVMSILLKVIGDTDQRS